jgi:hypothetical protein
MIEKSQPICILLRGDVESELPSIIVARTTVGTCGR